MRTLLAAGLILLGLMRAAAFSEDGRPPASDAAIRDKLEHARACESLERYQDAVDDFKAVLAVDPRNREARVELGLLCSRLGNWREAVNYFDSMLDEEPGNLRLRLELGRARRALGQLDAAADEFRLAASTPSEVQEAARSALGALTGGPAAQARANSMYAALDAGYKALRRGDRAAARADFERALTQDPSRQDLYKQIGYLCLADGDKASAIREFETVRRLNPDDYAAAMQLGYLYAGMSKKPEAHEAFEAAMGSPDIKVYDAARAALKVVDVPPERRLNLDVYASPLYLRRFDDRIVYGEAKLIFLPNLDSPLGFYLAGRVTADSKTDPRGNAGQVYMDNYASVGPGLKLQKKGSNLALWAEPDLDFNLSRTPEHPRATQVDYRVLLTEYLGWESASRRGFSDLNASAGYYSRYHDNVIGYLQARGGVGFWRADGFTLNAYVPVTVVKDANRDFFNNLAEGGAGLELRPKAGISFNIRAEFVHGVYFGIHGTDPNPYGRQYDDFRILFIIGSHTPLME